MQMFAKLRNRLLLGATALLCVFAAWLWWVLVGPDRAPDNSGLSVQSPNRFDAAEEQSQSRALEIPGDWMWMGQKIELSEPLKVPWTNSDGEIAIVPLTGFDFYTDSGGNFLRAHNEGRGFRTKWNVDGIRTALSTMEGAEGNAKTGVTLVGVPQVRLSDQLLQQCLGRIFGGLRLTHDLFDFWIVETSQHGFGRFPAVLVRRCSGSHEQSLSQPFVSLVFWSIYPLDPRLEQSGAGGTFSLEEDYEDGYHPDPIGLIEAHRARLTGIKNALETAEQAREPDDRIEKLRDALRVQERLVARVMNLYPAAARQAGDGSRFIAK
jgi:hypothetical protein